jgi:hypothetical protein
LFWTKIPVNIHLLYPAILVEAESTENKVTGFVQAEAGVET